MNPRSILQEILSLSPLTARERYLENPKDLFTKGNYTKGNYTKGNYLPKVIIPYVGLEPTTFRLEVWRAIQLRQ